MSKHKMQVSIVTFPETRVVSITHIGDPGKEHETALKLIDWKIKNQLLDQYRYRSYGLHYTDPRTVPPEEHRVDFCLSIDRAIESNDEGIVESTIPRIKCALAREVGSRANNQAARYLIEEWLPGSNEELADFPLIFHYVNVGPSVRENAEITDVYLPLK